MKTIKIVLISAASVTFGCGAVSDILSSKELKEFDLEVVLVDIDK